VYKTLIELANTPDTPLQATKTVNKVQVQSWLNEAGLKYQDAGRSANSNGTRLDTAYDATFFCALAVLASVGYRATSKPGHHEVAMEAAASTMKLQSTLYDEIEALRTWRNRKYQGSFSADAQDVGDALTTARRFLEATSAWLQREKPDLLK
jgi:uncharacterized protein (UPF0332 family)